MGLSRVQAIVEKQAGRPGATLPILHDIQAELGYISDEAIAVVAEGLNLSRAEIFGVVTFYADFRREPVGKNLVQVCRGEACQAMGGRKLEEHACRSLGCEFHQTTADGSVSLEPVFCLGNCACSPAIRIGDEIYGRVDESQFDELMGELRGGR
ncbi:MAG: formate dehydrogenase subunit gamma [Planctomycetota bacterium]